MTVASPLNAGVVVPAVRLDAAPGLHEDGMGAGRRGIPRPAYEHLPDAGSLLLHRKSTPPGPSRGQLEFLKRQAHHLTTSQSENLPHLKRIGPAVMADQPVPNSFGQGAQLP